MRAPYCRACRAPLDPDEVVEACLVCGEPLGPRGPSVPVRVTELARCLLVELEPDSPKGATFTVPYEAFAE